MGKKVKETSFEEMMVDVVGCKWTYKLLLEIEKGKNRPGQLRKALENMSAKVLSENTSRMISYRLVEKKEFDERLPHVEYSLTPFGKAILEALNQLNTIKGRFGR